MITWCTPVTLVPATLPYAHKIVILLYHESEIFIIEQQLLLYLDLQFLK